MSYTPPPSGFSHAYGTHHTSPLSAEGYELQLILADQLQLLGAQTSFVATTYRDMGFLYHSLPFNLIYDGRVAPNHRGFARQNFVVRERRELPAMIQNIGLLDHTLRRAANILSWSETDAQIARAQRLLRMCATWLQEACHSLITLQIVIDIYVPLREFRIAQTGVDVDGRDNRERRERARETWMSALPAACWG